MLSQDGLDPILILRINVAEDDGLGWAQYRADVVLVHDDPERALEAEVSLILDPPVVHVLSVEQLPVPLLPPPHPVVVLPLLHGPPLRDLHPRVAFHEPLKLVDPERVDEVLHAGIRADVAVAVVTLRGHDSLQNLHNVLLRDESHVVSRAGEGVLLVVGAPHAAAYHYVEPLELPRLVADDDAADVVRVNVEGVVPGDGDSDLKLSGEVLRAVDGLRGICQDDPSSVVMKHRLVDVVVRDLLRPRFDRGGLLPIQPYFREGRRHGAKKLREDLGVFTGEVVSGRVEGGGGRHDVAGDVAACTDGGGPDVHDGGDDGFKVAFQNAMHLEALSGSRTQVALAHVGREVVKQPVELRGELSGRLFEAEHELVIFGALLFAIVLLVRAVVLHDLVSVLRDADFFRLKLVFQRVAEIVRVYFELFDFGELFGWCLHLHV
mmetsp:Transcript_28688/g.60854  ORF Transcript_28688/g.60854 Transcript_28688/m.60854 type:complete len:435 (-) Transcript_28688:507-1811(-)